MYARKKSLATKPIVLPSSFPIRGEQVIDGVSLLPFYTKDERTSEQVGGSFGLLCSSLEALFHIEARAD